MCLLENSYICCCFFCNVFNLFAQFHLSRFVGTFLFYEFVISSNNARSHSSKWMYFNALRLPWANNLRCVVMSVFFCCCYSTAFLLNYFNAMSIEFEYRTKWHFNFARAFHTQNVEIPYRSKIDRNKWMEFFFASFVNFVYLFRFVFYGMMEYLITFSCVSLPFNRIFFILLNIIFTLHWIWLITPFSFSLVK